MDFKGHVALQHPRVPRPCRWDSAAPLPSLHLTRRFRRLGRAERIPSDQVFPIAALPKAPFPFPRAAP
jgi:hypothetical protein